MEVQGMRGNDPWLPHLLGHEGVGKVVEVGPGVTKVSSGQDVIIGWIESGGIAAPNPIFFSGDIKINAGASTTFSEFTVVSENRTYAKPDGISDLASVLFGCSILTGAGMVLKEMPPKETDCVLILGLGGIGMASLIGSLVSQPAKLICVDPSAEKRALATALGVDAVLDSADPEFVEHVRELSGGGADKCFESAGKTSSVELALECVRPRGGQVLFASHPPVGDRIRVNPLDLIRGKQLRGSWGGGSEPDVDIPIFAKKIISRGINLEILVNESYTLEDVNLALSDLGKGSAIRPVITIDS